MGRPSTVVIEVITRKSIVEKGGRLKNQPLLHKQWTDGVITEQNRRPLEWDKKGLMNERVGQRETIYITEKGPIQITENERTNMETSCELSVPGNAGKSSFWMWNSALLVIPTSTPRIRVAVKEVDFTLKPYSTSVWHLISLIIRWIEQRTTLVLRLLRINRRFKRKMIGKYRSSRKIWARLSNLVRETFKSFSYRDFVRVL